MIGEIISHFEIKEKLGEGGMGVVYKARDTKLDREVALKFISSDSTASDEDRERFLQEARAVAKLNHPNICSIYSIDEHEGQQFIEMEYIEGETLRTKMNKPGRIEQDLFRDFAIQLTEALSAAHRKGIVHRDIKPENIMVDTNGRVKVMDFGLAKLKGIESYTQTGSTLGTLTYMSPEQIRSEDIDERSDIFSLGIVFYEMLTGVHPFKAEYEQALMFKILNEDPEPPSLLHEDISTELVDVVMQCMEKDRQDRFDAADNIRIALEGKEQRPNQQRTQMGKNSNWDQFDINIRHSIQQNTIPFVLIASLVLIGAMLWIYLPSSTGESGATLPENKHIAVLPFNNLSPKDIPKSFNEGIMEILTSKITQMEMREGSIWAVSSSEVRAEKINSVKEATQKLGVNLAVTGSLKRINDQLQLTINLVDGKTRRQLSSQILEMQWDDHIKLQNEVVYKLNDMLGIGMEPRAVETVTAGGTQNSRVYQLYIEGRGYLSRRDAEGYNRAIELFQRTVNEDSDFVRGYAALAETYWRKYQHDHDTQWAKKALKFGRSAIERMEQDIPEVYITLALIYNGMEQYKEALEMLGNLNKQGQLGYQVLIEKANSYEGLGKVDKAEEFYQQAIDQREQYWDGYHNLGNFYFSQGRFAEAIESFEKVTKLAPERVDGFTNLGAAYYNSGKVDKALEAFNRSLKLKVNYVALENMGTIYYYNKNYSKALKMYEKALDINNTDRRIWGYLGYAYLRSNEDSSKVEKAMRKAIELTEKELEIKPNSQRLLGELAGYHLTIGNRAKARKILQQLISLGDLNSENRKTVINLYERLGERDLALQWVEKSLSKGDDISVLKRLEETEKLFQDPRFNELQKKY